MDKFQEMLEGIYGLMKELREFRHEVSEFRQEVNDRLDKKDDFYSIS